ncbi:MAG: hypothetical protein ACK6DP_05520 [Gemmatimonas sp.]|jgi:hypothetical protein|uniref:hypothetical protein n=1 Tax=Gemmatimonas sp. TaxID=1962908 RepID=UPI00391FB7BC|nr:hypothetical protein [Gemmatimonadota bacterium]
MDGMGWSVAGLVVVGVGAWYVRSRRSEVPCTVDLEMTHDHFHAHVDLKGVEVDPGDEVLVRNAPSRIAFGTTTTFESSAEVKRASWLKRQIVKLTGGTEIHELYEVGFEG